jgi:predicted dinucleotide-binding enzyme
MPEPLDIAIVGTGNIGRVLARHWRRAGHRIHLGARDPSDARAVALGEEVDAAPVAPAEAVEAASVVALAIPGGAVVPAAGELPLDGRAVVLPANVMSGGPPNLAQAVAGAAPGAQIIRAFNTIPWEAIERGGHDLFYAAPEEADELARGLICACGLRPLRLGGVERADLVDALFRAWAALAFDGGHGRAIAFALTEVES